MKEGTLIKLKTSLAFFVESERPFSKVSIKENEIIFIKENEIILYIGFNKNSSVHVWLYKTKKVYSLCLPEKDDKSIEIIWNVV